MPQTKVDALPSQTCRLKLLWNDSRCLNVYLTGTAAIAVWLKFAIMAVQWGSPGAWMP
jgi:hypothetical protein